jgi:hypothetical protein
MPLRVFWIVAEKKMHENYLAIPEYRYPAAILVFVFFIFLSVSAFPAENTVALAESGKAEAVIVIPSKAAPTEKFAARELKYYLDRISGASFKIVNQRPDSGYAIVLGDADSARKAGIDVDKLGRDEFIICVKGKTLFIAGKDEKGKKADRIFSLAEEPESEMKRSAGKQHFIYYKWDFDMATLLGVYRFLEKLGVRWFFPGQEGELVPRHEKLLFTLSKPLRFSPDFKMRTASPYFWPGNIFDYLEDKSFLVSPDEYKDLKWTAKKYKLWTIRMGGDGKWLAFNHSYPRTYWKERFAREHPEYFALLGNGKRDLPANLEDRSYRYHLCFTNPGTFKENLNDIDAFFSGEPASARKIPVTSKTRDTAGWDTAAAYRDTFSLLPHDSFKPCRCEECAKLLRDDLRYDALASDLVWGFVRKTAQAIEKKWPGKYLTCLAYSSFTQPPQGFSKLPDNVIIGFCPYRYSSAHFCVNKKNYNDLLRLAGKWNKYNNKQLLMWRHHLYRRRQPAHKYVPMHIPHQLAEQIKGLAKYTQFSFTEFDIDSVFYDHINRYVVQKVLWDTNVDVDKLIDDYLLNYYGPKAYPVMKKFYSDLEEKCTRIAELQAGRLAIYESYFNKRCIDNYEKMMKQALKLTKDTEYHKRVQYVSKYIVAGIKRGYDGFKDKLSKLTPDSSVPVYYTNEPVNIDGNINEKAWGKSELMNLVNNVDSGKPEWKTDVRVLRDEKNLYFAFDCQSPDVRQDIKNKQYDSVEIFLDDNNNQDSYYQILINNNGEVKDIFFEGRGEKGNSSWSSGLRKAIKIGKDNWTVELAVPLKNLKGGNAIKSGSAGPWGMNVCRTIANPPADKDKFNTFSKLITGKFAQPDLFAKIYFLKDPRPKASQNPGNLIKNSSFENWLSSSVAENWRSYFTGKSTVSRDSVIVHTGKYSAKLAAREGTALVNKNLLLRPGTGKSDMIFKNGKYRLGWYWYSPAGKMYICLSVKALNGKEWYEFNPAAKNWVKSPSAYHYSLIKGAKKNWNHTEIELDLDFPHGYGYLIFRVFNNDTLYLDDVSLEKYQNK